ncbi:hypothetical protein [Streptomyces sp. NPDC058739]
MTTGIGINAWLVPALPLPALFWRTAPGQEGTERMAAHSRETDG